MNPVFLLDEVDKMSSDFRGDPAAALLEVLDPEQNHAFSDHYLEIGFDLSRIMFITTANTTFRIPPALLDRMEMLNLPGYTEEEKIMIAKNFLIPKQLPAHGLKPKNISFSNNALQKIIRLYTREAGVRNLEREIANICRKIAVKLLKKKDKTRSFKVTPAQLKSFLGVSRFDDTNHADSSEVGVSIALAWTEFGGDTLQVETIIMSGTGKLTLTGKMGEVMQESAKAALSYVRSKSALLGLQQDFYEKFDIHIHVPEGAIPKDGPSAGIALAASLISAATRNPLQSNVAMTGEITIRGRVLPVGGLKEKILAANRANIKKILISETNRKNLDDIPKNILKKIDIIPVKTMDDVLKVAFSREFGDSSGV
jgi:ATP-dependent Lon protease